MNIVFTAIMSSLRKLKEPNCWGISLQTQEIPMSKFEDLTHMHNDYVKVLMSSGSINDKQIELVEKFPVEIDEKWTKSQKQRFAIMEWAGRLGYTDEKDLINFYNEKMDSIIDQINKRDT